MAIKKFSIEYDAINSKNAFTNGDIIHGRIIAEVSKDTCIQSLIFIAKGKAKVCWYEHYGQNVHVVIWANEEYFKIKHHILREARQNGTEAIGRGRHVFPFSFKIPNRNLPSSLKAQTGKVVYELRAELKQSMRVPLKAKTNFTFVSKADMGIPGLMEPQYGCKDKSVTFFGSGNISMEVHTKRMGYRQGEALKVTAEINNYSTCSVKPKFVLYEKKSFFAQGRRRVSTNEVLEEKCEPIASSSRQTVTKVITIPEELPPSILNCSLIKLEYRLKVVLGVSVTKNPEVKLPIVILPYETKSVSKEQEAYWNESQNTW